MANLNETPQWEDGIYQIETQDRVVGGADGIANRQAKLLANRTKYLKTEVEKRTLISDLISRAIDKGAALVGWKQSGTGAVDRTVGDKLREFVSVKDFGAVGDGVADDTAAIQAAWAWVFGGSNRRLVVPAGNYRATSRISTSVSGMVRNCHIDGAGATILCSAGGGFDLTVTGIGLISDLSIKGLVVSGGSDCFKFNAESIDRYIYNMKLEGVSVDGFSSSGLVLNGNIFETVIDHCSGSADNANSTGYGILLQNSGTGVISSIDIIGGTWRGGKHCLYAPNPVQDLNIFGGTYLFAKEEGIRIDNSVGVGIYGPHLEGNWESAGTISSGGAGLRVSGFGVISSPKGYCNASQKQKYVVQVYATSPGMTIIGGCKQGSTLKFGQYQQPANGELILIGTNAQDYDAVGEVFPTIIGTKNYAKQQGMMENFISYAATRAPDMNKGSFIRIGTLTGNITIDNPINITPRTGDTIIVELKQDGTGGRTVSWGSNFASGISAIDSAANKTSRWSFIWSDSKWKQIAFASTF